jgi:hypothetical protein
MVILGSFIPYPSPLFTSSSYFTISYSILFWVVLIYHYICTLRSNTRINIMTSKLRITRFNKIGEPYISHRRHVFIKFMGFCNRCLKHFEDCACPVRNPCGDFKTKVYNPLYRDDNHNLPIGDNNI